MEIREWATRILYGDSLIDKQYFPETLTDTAPGLAVAVPHFPGRPYGLAPLAGPRPPLPASLREPRNRGLVLHYFANHELLALELMALALLRFPLAPAGFRRAIVTTLRDEQRHLGLYLERMATLGVSFGELPISDFFWRNLAPMASPMAYLAGMSLTFEQANLDHALHFTTVFTAMGDHETADLLQLVHDDEIGHVRVGAGWLSRLDNTGADLWTLHQAHLVWPLTPQRAKAKTFFAAPRIAAGLDPQYIEELRVYSQTRGRSPDIYWFNSDCELEVAAGAGYTPSATLNALMRDLEALPLLLAAADDIVFVREPQAASHLGGLAQAGIALPEFITCGATDRATAAQLNGRKVGRFRPWGVTPRTLALGRAVGAAADPDWDASPYPGLYPKPAIIPLREAFRKECGRAAQLLGDPSLDGKAVHTLDDAEAVAKRTHTKWQRPTVFKAPYGASGQNVLRVSGSEALTEKERAWLSRILGQHGVVLAEPWLVLVHDFSAQLRFDRGRVDPVVAISRFLTDHRGQYRGHILGKATHGLESKARAELCRRTPPLLSLQDLMRDAAGFAAQHLADSSYLGPASLDMFIFRDPANGELRLRGIGEINPRFTMGHVALSLGPRLAPEAQGLFAILGPRDLKQLGCRDFTTLQAELLQIAPLKSNSEGRWTNGAIFLTDPRQARMMAAVTLVGTLPERLAYLCQESAES